MNVNYAKFQTKFDIVEQFQGNYLKRSTGTAAEMPPYEINKDSSSPLEKTKKHAGWSISRKSSTKQHQKRSMISPEAEEDLSVDTRPPKKNRFVLSFIL